MIMMTPADVEALIAWQATRIKIDMAYNAYPSANSEFPGSAALTTSLLGNKVNLRWINHTYDHLYFGCNQFPDPPYNCTTQPVTSWVPTATILEDIESNIAWAQANGIDIDATELISGEHSGLADQNRGARPARQPGIPGSAQHRYCHEATDGRHRIRRVQGTEPASGGTGSNPARGTRTASTTTSPPRPS